MSFPRLKPSTQFKNSIFRPVVRPLLAVQIIAAEKRIQHSRNPPIRSRLSSPEHERPRAIVARSFNLHQGAGQDRCFEHGIAAIVQQAQRLVVDLFVVHDEAVPSDRLKSLCANRRFKIIEQSAVPARITTSNKNPVFILCWEP